MLSGLISRFYCACGLDCKYVLCLRDDSIDCACEVVYCFAPIARCVLLGLVVIHVSRIARHCSFLTRLFSVSSFKLSRNVFSCFGFLFSGSYTQVFLVIGQRPIASFEGANSEA